MVRQLVRRIAERTRFRPDPLLIGLDIGTSAIKAVQLAPAGQTYRVAAFATELLPAGAVVDGDVADRSIVGGAIRRALQARGFRPGPVAVALARQAVLVKRITLPAMTARELHEAVAWEAEQHVPFPLAEVRLHYQRIDGGRVGGGTADVLLVAARRDRIAALTSLVREAGCSAAVVDVGALALLSAYLANHDAAAASTTGLLDIGASATTVSIAVNGSPAFVRHIAMGAEAVVGIRPQAAAATVPACEDLAWPPRLDPARHPEPEGVPGPGVERLISDVRKTLEFLQAKTGVDAVDRLAVTGGGSLAPGVLERLGDRLGLLVEPLNPFRRILCCPECPVGTARIAALAVGLAMRRQEDLWRE